MVKVGLLTGLVLVAGISVAEARTGTSANYHAYGYGSHSPSYKGYSGYRSGGSKGRYWGGVSVKRYNDPTGRKLVEVRPPVLPRPSGIYSRASSRLRNAY